MAPFLSVVIVTCGRPSVLGRTLESLTPERQRVPGKAFEVIVADDSRDDATRAMVADRFPQAVYVKGRGRGPASNRNSGAGQAKGEWLAFIDDDCQPADGWARALLERAAAPGIDVVEGRIFVPDKTESPFRRHVENLTGGNFWSGNLAIRRAVFARLGGFDEDFLEAGGEDMEFGERIRGSGVGTSFCAEATVIHPSHPVSWRYLFWRAFLARWHLLYQLKTGRGVPLSATAPRVLGSLLVSRTLALLRSSWHSVRRRQQPWGWTIFSLLTSWMMFPIVLPYLAYWELRFRRQIRARQPAAVHPAS